MAEIGGTIFFFCQKIEFRLRFDFKLTAEISLRNRVARFFVVQYTKMGKYVPSNFKIYQLATTNTNKP
jgi:hypothetical protein